ncbi:hypothetical protein A1O3_08650 [Capronia epimyces CBS 606.96]|uniref:5-Methylcytosine G/T mismatch-specific DNA glycosylase n=1 Tax=Capronia epimyces CBS 606.96 TaxID=1182542 RepID=W9Y9T5_9EURO|nr:uncharacterized protein A1O3_08650 [Capronia epimyces CBS 606.96]EXJ79149.1 hypothetical protein A1O3_08650 [Capronia epimyces CBS 606.96]
MPFKVRDSSVERRREKKETARLEKPERDRKDRDRDRDKDRQDRQDRHRSHRKLSTKDKTNSRTSLSPADNKRRSSMPGKIEDGPLTKSDSKSSLPYPSFSKEHSREAVSVTSRPVLNVYTPPATDVNASKDRLSTSKSTSAASNRAPPSPPLTDQNSGSGKWRSNAGKPVSVETIPEEKVSSNGRDPKSKASLRPHSSKSNGHLRSTSELGADGLSARKHRDTAGSPLKVVTANHAAIPIRSVSQPIRIESPATTTSASESVTNISSEATSIAPEQPSIQRPGSKVPPAAVFPDVQPHGGPDVRRRSRGVTPLEVFDDGESSILSATPGGVSATPGPPPPPPAPALVAVPKVDYLLQHGGLSQTIPKNLLLAGKPMAIQQAQSASQPPVVVAHLFEPYTALLDDYEKVMSKNGSIAVATGYRSVARRLLERLEAVFARDISSEACQCPMCEYDGTHDVRSVSWGEVLELVSGRKSLPPWPPFAFTQSPVGLGISLELHVPMQKLDIDVPEEYREHYIRQSRKTKQSVDKWLNRQSDCPSSPPEEVDDETLAFAILTHLPAEHRPVFKDLLGIVDRPVEPPRRAPTPEVQTQNDTAPRLPRPTPTPTPAPRTRPEHIATASQAIQRLYRLPTTPRDSETALFLLNNPTLHNALATLAAISNDEWDILTSGRFDGFLRSGAEEVPLSMPEMGTPSRGPTPYRPPTRGVTPGYVGGSASISNGNGYGSQQGSYSYASYPSTTAQYGAPIAFDEETELATLAEVEREIYAGMEALEDAFEALHVKAETVRRDLRERAAGLAATAQRRRGNLGGGIEVRMDTPASGIHPTFADGGVYGNGNGHVPGSGKPWDAETDDGLGEWDGYSEIEPDDSASNISSARRRRPKRRNERRTPALIEEEDEDEDVVSEATGSPRKR